MRCGLQLKKQKKVKPGSPGSDEEGDAWIYGCIKRGSYLFIAYSVGKWTQETCREMIDKMFTRIELPFPENKIQIFSDGNDDYEYVLPEYYADTCVDYGQVVKIREEGRVVDKIKRIVFGNPKMEDIETTNIENFIGILRERVGRLVRKTKCYSKRKSRLKDATELIQFHWNFMDTIHDNETPGIIESLTDHVWSWNEFLYLHYAV
jgi:IS1 family transposase